MHRDGASCPYSLAIDRCSGGHNAGVRIDLEQAVNVSGQAVGNCVRSRVEVKRIGCDANRRTNGDILINVVGVVARIGWRSNVEFIEIVDRDVECLRCN